MTACSQKARKELSNLLRARFPYIYIPTWEEERAVDMIEQTVHDESYIRTVRKVYQWSQAGGFRDEEDKRIAGTGTPVQAIDFICRSTENAVFILKDFHVYFGVGHRPADFEVIRRLRDALPELKFAQSMKNVIFISPSLNIPDDMQKEISIFDFPLPSEAEIREKLEEIIEENGSLQVRLDEDGRAQLARAAVGLTLQEAENAFSRAIVSAGCLDKSSLRPSLRRKTRSSKRPAFWNSSAPTSTPTTSAVWKTSRNGWQSATIPGPRAPNSITSPPPRACSSPACPAAARA